MIYGTGFARAYDSIFGRLADSMAQRYLLCATQLRVLPPGHALDLCCGTGRLVAHFVASGFRVTGLDFSPGMLDLAARRNRDSVAAGLVSFVQGDAADFAVTHTYSIVVSATDSLAHLADGKALSRCVGLVKAALATRGIFMFDLQTRRGLAGWNDIGVTDRSDVLMVERGVWDGEASRVGRMFSGCVQGDDGVVERFQQLIYNQVYAMSDIETIVGAHFSDVTFLSPRTLSPTTDPEDEDRVVVIAR